MTRQQTTTIATVLVAGLVLGNVSAQMPYGNTATGEVTDVPRVSTPSAHLQEHKTASVVYAYRGADYKGRDMETTQYGFTYGITDKLEFGVDQHKMAINGRTAGNEFDADGTGFQLRYATELLNTDSAVYLEFRKADGRVIQTGARRIPPDAETWTLGAVCTEPFGKNDRNRLHIRVSASRSEVGNQNAMTWILGGGVDHDLSKDWTAQADVTAFKETGDISSFEFALSGGVHYDSGSGFFADVNGTLLPSGTPLAGNPLADGSVFILDPVFRAEPIVRDFQDDALGFYTVRVGYTKEL
ncbi:MAG TPA: hypothetical protein QGH10_26095 [Armatimonadota bacterium]|jgi:hypothetical protein|nr:hypothetical protein [Armatimonadota bacterium]